MLKVQTQKEERRENFTEDASRHRGASRSEARSHVNDFKFKYVLVGDSKVGKTSLLVNLVDVCLQQCPCCHTLGKDCCCHTLGKDCCKASLSVPLEAHTLRVGVEVWDTNGDRCFRQLTEAYYRCVHGVALVFDVCNESSLQSLDGWFASLEPHITGIQPLGLVLVGNKAEQSKRAVSKKRAQALADKWGVLYFEVSAVRGRAEGLSCISDVFEALARDSITKKPVTIHEPKAQITTLTKPSLRNQMMGRVSSRFLTPKSSAAQMASSTTQLASSGLDTSAASFRHLDEPPSPDSAVLRSAQPLTPSNKKVFSFSPAAASVIHGFDDVEDLRGQIQDSEDFRDLEPNDADDALIDLDKIHRLASMEREIHELESGEEREIHEVADEEEREIHEVAEEKKGVRRLHDVDLTPLQDVEAGPTPQPNLTGVLTVFPMPHTADAIPVAPTHAVGIQSRLKDFIAAERRIGVQKKVSLFLTFLTLVCLFWVVYVRFHNAP
eukprot:g5316.t1